MTTPPGKIAFLDQTDLSDLKVITRDPFTRKPGESNQICESYQADGASGDGVATTAGDKTSRWPGGGKRARFARPAAPPVTAQTGLIQIKAAAHANESFVCGAEVGMKWISALVGIAIACLGQGAMAKSRLTDPLKIARECKSEAEQFCKGVRAGGKRIVTCLKAKAVDLSPACLAALNAAE